MNGDGFAPSLLADPESVLDSYLRGTANLCQYGDLAQTFPKYPQTKVYQYIDNRKKCNIQSQTGTERERILLCDQYSWQRIAQIETWPRG